MLTKEEVENLMKIEGNVRGEGLLTNIEYVRLRKGEEGVKAVEKKLEELGYPVVSKKIQPLEWYPEALGVLVILVIKEVFNLTDKDIFEMGAFAPRISFVIKMLLKYFLSARKSFKESPKYWSANYDFGELEAHEFNEKKKYVVLRVKKFKFHPILCVYLAGYMLQFAKYVIKSKEVTIKETKCMLKGNLYHEYVIKWV